MKRFIKWIKNKFYKWETTSESKIAEKVRYAHMEAFIKRARKGM